MAKARYSSLSRRERQIMEILWRLGRASAVVVREELADNLSDSAVRTFLRILEGKGHLRHVEEEGRFIYLPVRSRQAAARSAVKSLLGTFFGNSVEQAVVMLLDQSDGKLSREEYEKLAELLRQKRESH
jgi:predicted transcriptional regulator